jgi:hypothetical protein
MTSKKNKNVYDAMTYAQIKVFNEMLKDYDEDHKFVKSIRTLIEGTLPESSLFGSEIFDRITANIAAKQFNRIFHQKIHPKICYIDINTNGNPKRVIILRNNPGLFSIDGRIGGEVTLAEEEISFSKMTMTPNLVKVNLPDNKNKFAKGLGEGVWVIVDKATMAAYNSNTQGGIYTGILDNDSLYYPDLKCGCLIRFEMRGMNRAVALI